MPAERKPNEPQTGADIVVKTLERQNVKWVFGIPGAKIDKVFNTLADSPIQTIVCRHEQNAAFIFMWLLDANMDVHLVSVSRAWHCLSDCGYPRLEGII
jgi:hypothetical protein